jgi:SAM-dependent methyltransferase
MRILLDAVAAVAPELLRKTGSGYALTPVARTFLVPSRPEYVGPLMPLYGHRMMWDAFWNLPAAVKAGRSVLEKDAHAKDQKFWEDFARATAKDAVPKARCMLKLLGALPARPEVIDLACGSGAYGATFARELRGARITLFDQPNVLRITRNLVRARVRYLAGDIFRTPLGGPYDVAIASHIFHHFDRRECARLARKVFEALRPGGRLVVQEFVPDEGRRSKAQPLLFAVTMLVWTRAGDAYTRRDYEGWFRKAGFRKVTYHPLAMPGDVLIGTK